MNRNHLLNKKAVIVLIGIFLIFAFVSVLFNYISNNRLVSKYTFTYSLESPISVPVEKKQYNKFLGVLQTDPNYLYIPLDTVETKELTGFAFLFFDPRIKDNLTLSTFKSYFIPQKTRLNINFFKEKIKGSHAIISTSDEGTIKNLQVHFDAYENKILTGSIEFDISAVRFDFPKGNTSGSCVDPGFSPGGFERCFDKVLIPADKKVTMPFKIQDYE